MLKKCLALAATIFSFSAVAQKKITEGAIYAKMTMTSNAETNVEDMGNANNGGGMRFGGDQDMDLTIMIKGNKIRTDIKNETFPMTIIRDKDSAMSVTLMSMMGQKTAMVSRDRDFEKMINGFAERAIDSVRKARRDSLTRKGFDSMRVVNQQKTYEFAAGTKTKKIAGFKALEGLVIGKTFLGVLDTTVIYYTPEIEQPDVVGSNSSTTMQVRRGPRQGGGMAQGFPGMEKVPGLVLEFDRTDRNFSMHYQVTKVDLEKKVDDASFSIPKGYEIKNMTDMMNNMRGNGGIRMETRVVN